MPSEPKDPVAAAGMAPIDPKARFQFEIEATRAAALNREQLLETSIKTLETELASVRAVIISSDAALFALANPVKRADPPESQQEEKERIPQIPANPADNETWTPNPDDDEHQIPRFLRENGNAQH